MLSLMNNQLLLRISLFRIGHCLFFTHVCFPIVITSATEVVIPLFRNDEDLPLSVALALQPSLTALAQWIERWCSDQGDTGSNPTAVSMSLCLWALHPKLLL